MRPRLFALTRPGAPIPHLPSPESSTSRVKLWSLLAALGLAAALLAVAPAGAEPSTDGPVPPAGEESSPDPSPVPPGEEAALVGAAPVATGYYHSCARLANNQVRCWGYN